MPEAAPAIPEKPKIAAIIAITKKVMAQDSIVVFGWFFMVRRPDEFVHPAAIAFSVR